MKVLFLGPVSKVSEYLKRDHTVLMSDVPVEPEPCEWLISYGFRHKIPMDLINKFEPGRAINLHISYLPFNRGADPNLWSWIEDTPKGVTIHGLTDEIDKGPIYHRRLVAMLQEPPVDYRGREWPHETLKTSYDKLQEAMFQLFKDTWPKAYARGKYLPCTQPKEEGSVHTKADREKVQHLLTQGWDTPAAGLKL